MTQPEKAPTSIGDDLSAARDYIKNNCIVIGPDDPRSTIQVAEEHLQRALAAAELVEDCTIAEATPAISGIARQSRKSLRTPGSKRMGIF